LHLAPESRQITTPAPHHSLFYRPETLPDTNTVKVMKASQSTEDKSEH